MLQSIKKKLPKPVKEMLVRAKQKTYDHWQKKRLFKRMQRKHAELLNQVKGKKKIKVVFLAIHKSVWKVDPVFQRMLEDPFFDPEVLVCPCTPYGEERMLEDMGEAYTYFLDKGYPVRKALKESGAWLTLDEIKPDIVFFTNPHKLTRKEYYEDAYFNYLSCYVPYYSDIASNYDVAHAYNQIFHNVVWIQFLSDIYSLQRASKALANKGSNIFVVGSPLIEQIVNVDSCEKKIWKQQERGKKKIIYAPHQSILKDDVINLSTFLDVADVLKNLAIKYKDEVQWSFKPHPLLKEKLYRHPDWGKDLADSYYSFWSNNTHTQLDTGEYAELFMTSDAIIHDCGSFILDYLVTRKPCAYLELNGERQLKAINGLGLKALKCYERVKEVGEIEVFLKRVLYSDFLVSDDYVVFLKEHVDPFYTDASPSGKIIERLKGFLL